MEYQFRAVIWRWERHGFLWMKKRKKHVTLYSHHGAVWLSSHGNRPAIEVESMLFDKVRAMDMDILRKGYIE